MKKQKNLTQLAVEAPAVLLDKTITATGATATAVNNRIPGGVNVVKKTKDYWHALGPGLTTGAADDDPSGVATYSQTGAQFGYSYLWLAPITLPLMAVVQEMCARIGMVTGRGLAANIRLHFSNRVLRVVTLMLFAANTFNLGADLGAIAKAVQLLAPNVPFWSLVVGFAALSLLMQIFTPYAKYARYLKWLALVLLSYVISALLAHLNWGEILRSTVTPNLHFTKESLLLICAILGTTISPYLFFWQTSQEVEEQIEEGKITLRQRRVATHPDAMKRMRIDIWSGMFLSNLSFFFIVAACGGVLHTQGITNITSAAQAAEALRPFAGEATYLLFTIGIVGVGLLAIPVLAGSSSYAIAESFKWKSGLHQPLRQAYAFYGVIIISMLVGLGLNFIGLDPIKALIYSAVGNGLVAPIVLFFIVKMGSSKAIMGRWRNRTIPTIIGWVTFAVMLVSGVAAIWALLTA